MIETTLREEYELWAQIPDEALLPPKELIFCPFVGGSRNRPRHLVTLAKWRTAGTGPPFIKINGRIYYPFGGVRKYPRKCGVKMSTTK